MYSIVTATVILGMVHTLIPNHWLPVEAAGLVSGVIGGIVVGLISGSRTCFSGPATGLGNYDWKSILQM